MGRCMYALGFFALTLLLAGCDLVTQEKDAEKPDKDKKEKSAPAAAKDHQAKSETHLVEKGPFKIEISLKGILESEEMTEVAVTPEVWGPRAGGEWIVLKAVEHGARTHKGDTLITFDPKRIDQEIKDLVVEGQLADLAIKLAQEELPALEKSLPVELASAERAKKVADEDLKRFLEVERAAFEKTAHFEFKSAGNYLQYAKEELRQLEKMYRAKDLTEETEEIILKRTRDGVERATFYYQMAELDRDLILKIGLPRRDQNLRENSLKAGLALERAKSTLPLTLSQKKEALNKVLFDHAKAVDKLAKLRKDREAMTIKSPADGIVYHGKCSRGHWTESSAAETKLHRGGVLPPEEVFMTIVKPQSLFVRAVVEEKELHYLRPGAKGKVVMTGFPDLKLPAKVLKVSPIPIIPEKFEARVSIELGENAETLMAGMMCAIKLVPYHKADAITVPVGAVFAEELDEDSHYVYVEAKNKKTEKRPVVVGRKTEKEAEILKGLHEGEEILLEKPPRTKKAGASSKEEKP